MPVEAISISGLIQAAMVKVLAIDACAAAGAAGWSDVDTRTCPAREMERSAFVSARGPEDNEHRPGRLERDRQTHRPFAASKTGALMIVPVTASTARVVCRSP